MRPPQRPVVLVATPGGHLHELYEIARRIPSERPRVWVTSQNAHSTSLLADEEVIYAPSIGPRQALRALAAGPGALRLMRRLRPYAVISTGAALCVPYLLAARALRIPTHFIESMTRVNSLSVTGRMLAAVPGIKLLHQGMTRPGDRWHFIGSTLDGYEARTSKEGGHVKRVLVTLGTERFPFPRLIDNVREGLLPDTTVIWQTGHTQPPEGLPGEVNQWLPYDQMISEIDRADVVVTHAGVGSVLTALHRGVIPVILARSAKAGEHVDDHQDDFRTQLRARDLAVDLHALDATTAFQRAASSAVTNREPAPLDLG